MIKIITIMALLFGTLWDGFTTLYGTQQILGGSEEQLIAATVFAIIIFGFMISTMIILRTEGLFGFFLKVLWFIVVVYDFYTSYWGNIKFTIGNSTSINSEQFMLIIVFTILATSSPMIVGLFLGGNSNSRN